ncbi:MAG: hypothetical protein PHF39_10320 [Methanoregula sp.]|nr:hypothetical protein [Methanoregula sp.]
MNNPREKNRENTLMATDRNPLLLLPYLAFFLPLYIETSGSKQAFSLQWAMFRCQVMAGNDILLIPLSKEILSILTGHGPGEVISGMVVWLVATICLVGAFILTLYGFWKTGGKFVAWVPGLLLISGALFLMSGLVRYAVATDPPGKLFVPVGILFIFFAGWWGYRNLRKAMPEQETDVPTSPVTPVRFFGVPLKGIGWQVLKADLIILAFTGLVVKLLVISVALPALEHILTADMTLYYWYAESIFHGRLPYISFYAEYPQLFFLPLIIAYLPLLSSPDFTGFLFTFGTMNLLFDLGTLACVYILAARFFGQTHAFRAGLLYATAFSTAFFIPILFDIIPTFFLVFSLCCFIHGKEMVSYLSAATGVLLKWFPFACFPVFFLSNLKNGRDMKNYWKGVAVSILAAAACMVPFVLLNTEKFIETYRFHIVRQPEAHSFVYYLDTIFSFFHVQAPANLFLIIMVFAECLLLYWYFRHLDTSELTLTCVLLLSVLVFFLCNKVMATYYLVWLTPFLAIFLLRSLRHLVLFYVVQVVMFLETPALMGIVYKPYWDYSVLENSLPSIPFIFYTVKFAIFFVLLYAIVRDLRHLRNSPSRPEGIE